MLVRQGPGDNATAFVSHTATMYDTQTYVIVPCAESVHMRLQYHFVNPGGEELSTGQIPLKRLSVVFTCVWAAVWGLWAVNFVAVHQRSPVLHRAVGLVPLVHVCKSLAVMAFWRDFSHTGEVSESLYILDLMSEAAASAVLISVAILVAQGWWITRLTLRPAEWKTNVCLTLLYLLSIVSWQYVGGFFFLFCLVMLWITVLRALFVALTVNMRVLALRLHLAAAGPAAGSAAEAAPQSALQFVVLRRFRSCLVLFMTMNILFSVWSVMSATLQRDPYVSYIMQEGCRVVFVAYLVAEFRLGTLVWWSPRTDALLSHSGAHASNASAEPEAVMLVRNPDTAALAASSAVDGSSAPGGTVMMATAYRPTVCDPPLSWRMPTSSDWQPPEVVVEGRQGGGAAAGSGSGSGAGAEPGSAPGSGSGSGAGAGAGAGAGGGAAATVPFTSSSATPGAAAPRLRFGSSSSAHSGGADATHSDDSDDNDGSETARLLQPEI